MTAAATVHWACPECTTIGVTDRSAEQHTRATGHSTLTATNADALGRMRARAGGEGA